jgi:multidrug transporter EmrE-like cation transporter
MKTPVVSIVLFAIAAVLGAAGQFLYKSGAARIADSLWSFLNLRLLGGAVCYVGVMVLFVAAFKRGGALSVLYPVYASTFIWAAIISLAAYGTPIKPANIAGMVLLVAGMFLMGR